MRAHWQRAVNLKIEKSKLLLNQEDWIAQLDPTKETECVIQVTSSNPAGGVKN
jgi:hypothetical protein